MTQEIEIEYKNLLTKAEYHHILTTYPLPEEATRQTNYYFETPDYLLKKNKCALRIRQKNGSYTLTLKEPHVEGLLETHDSLTKSEVDGWLNGHIAQKGNVIKRLTAKQIPIQSITYLGSLITNRREINYQNILLVLDYSIYNHQTDYELEIEAPSVEIGQTFFTQFLRDNKIVKRDTPNKIQRFFDTLS